jgi:hypothetical protein
MYLEVSHLYGFGSIKTTLFFDGHVFYLMVRATFFIKFFSPFLGFSFGQFEK